MEVAQPAGPEAGEAIDGSALLKVLVPLLWKLPNAELRLSGIPLTAAVVRAIAAAAPRLSVLTLSSYNLSYCTGLRGSLPFRPTLSGVQGLLRLTAPHLQQLRLDGLRDGASGLTFDCAVELPSLPLLCRLKRLETLQLHPGEGGLVEGWDSELALRAALLVLCAEAPRLKELFLCLVPSDAQEQLLEASEQAIHWLMQELPMLRDDPPSLRFGVWW
ncbi:hypothetical protein TSOC_004105 [Tetrabaena socialis]|uniref:Uncharacterized protein n=1 Tax=Tetrabaena socialis TaxID=47790 RepID=A0A2J8A9T7_9CHLO|nr:hypothetical protein TSOC_004105 [Tetrabaena socialis]|eukprot:PNH09294.1 hypothetical protein TSOC_004105 [Tetrabaena socialis]